MNALCAALRRNDPDTTEIPNFYLSDPTGRRLGEALQGNHYVSFMDLIMSDWLDVNEDGTADSIVLLLRYIRESEAMRKVVLREFRGAHLELIAPLVPLFLLAIAENPCIIELNLDWIQMEEFPECLSLFLRRTRSLKTLRIKLGLFDEPASCELVAEAFGVNRTLETLTFQENSDTGTMESILLRMGSHHPLRELALYCGRAASVAEIHALASFLRSTTSLEHLNLHAYVFDKERMEHLVEGLHSNQSLTKLALQHCRSNLEATKVFRTFMQSCEKRSSIRELCFGHPNDALFGFRGHPDDMFKVFPDGAMLASILTLPDENPGTGSSIGSSLQVLYLHNDFAGFCDTLAANASRIRLPCLRISDVMGYAHWGVLIRCLPKLVHLKELEARTDYGPDYGPDFLDYISHYFIPALRANGSLQRVIFTPADSLDEAESCLIQSICKRNEVIPIFVAKVRLDNGDDDDDKTNLSLLPTIFKSAKQALRTAPNSMLIALLDAGDSIGPRGGIKRPHQHSRCIARKW